MEEKAPTSPLSGEPFMTLGRTSRLGLGSLMKHCNKMGKGCQKGQEEATGLCLLSPDSRGEGRVTEPLNKTLQCLHIHADSLISQMGTLTNHRPSSTQNHLPAVLAVVTEAVQPQSRVDCHLHSGARDLQGAPFPSAVTQSPPTELEVLSKPSCPEGTSTVCVSRGIQGPQGHTYKGPWMLRWETSQTPDSLPPPSPFHSPPLPCPSLLCFSLRTCVLTLTSLTYENSQSWLISTHIIETVLLQHW